MGKGISEWAIIELVEVTTHCRSLDLNGPSNYVIAEPVFEPVMSTLLSPVNLAENTVYGISPVTVEHSFFFFFLPTTKHLVELAIHIFHPLSLSLPRSPSSIPPYLPIERTITSF